MNNIKQLIAKATNPKAYNEDDVNWAEEQGNKHERQKLYVEYFLPLKDSWMGKDVLDVGCGTGFLPSFFDEHGARSVEAIDPSIKNLRFARSQFPHVKFTEIDLLNFYPAKEYDLISSIMVLVHFEVLESAFTKFFELLKPHGELFIVVPDFKYFRTPRHGYKLNIVELGSDEYLAETERPHFNIVDIVRNNELYIEAAKKSNLELLDSTPIVPTKEFRNELLQYEEFKAQPLLHLLRFSKVQKS